MRKLLNRFESVFVIIILSVYFGIHFPGMDPHKLGMQESDPYAFAINILLVGFLVIVAVSNRRGLLAAQREVLLLWVLVALTFISALWADTPAVVLRRSGNIFLTTAFSVYLYHRYGLQFLVGIFTRVHALIILASFGILLATPNLGLSAWGETGSWQGAFVGKNALGEVAALGILTASYSFAIRANSRIVATTVVVCNFILLRMSHSITGMVALGLGLGVGIVGSLMQSRNSVWNIIAGIVVLVGMLIAVTVYLSPNDVFAVVGRSSDLSGRTEIWRAVMVAIQQRPLLGYGFGGFWLPGNVAANHVWAVIQWGPPNAHNGWLDLVLQLGIVGVSVALVLWLISVWRCLRLIITRQGNGVLYCAALLACLLLISLTESVILRQAHFTWMLFVVVYLHLAYSAKYQPVPSEVTVREQIGLMAE
ncbi:exopolysaccharide production protein ExoQ [Gammaproteobacteria bacterium]